jgi:PrcB C-terminal
LRFLISFLADKSVTKLCWTNYSDPYLNRASGSLCPAASCITSESRCLRASHELHFPDRVNIRAAWFVTLILATLIASALAYATTGQPETSDSWATNRSGIATAVSLAKTTPIETVTSGSGICAVTITPGGPVPTGPCGPAYPNGFRQLTEIVIRDQATWTRIWSQGFCAGQTSCNSNPPNIDFSSETVIAVFQGWKASSGYNVRILGADHKGHEMIVHVEVTEPGPYCLGLAILTYPFDIVSIPDTRFTIVFDSTTIATSCK